MKKMMKAVGFAAASVLTPVMVCAALLLWVIACDVAAFLFPVDVPEWPFHFDLTLYAVCALLGLCAVLSFADFWRRRWRRGIGRMASLFVGFAFLCWCGPVWEEYQRHNLTPRLTIRIVMDRETIGTCGCGDVVMRTPEDVYDFVRPVVRKLRRVKVVFALGNDNITAEDFAKNFCNRCTAAGAWEFSFDISGQECGFFSMPPCDYGGRSIKASAVMIAPDGTCTYKAAWDGENEEGEVADDAFDAPRDAVYREGGSLVLVFASPTCILSDIVEAVCDLSAFYPEVDLLFM